ncbi:MAG TPA: hypothetical protein VFU23_02270 [Gemmatimonadales bacterium]|nr:hypothetical protein [Gemmatimonadales bacterium]
MRKAWILAGMVLSAPVWAASPPDRRPKDAATVKMDQMITYPGDPPRRPWSSDETVASGDRARDPVPGRGPRHHVPERATRAQARRAPRR